MVRSVFFLSSLALLAANETASARVYSPRVVSPRAADTYSMKTFAQFPRWRDLKGDQKAWEIYKYLVDARTGVFHMSEVLEGDDTLSEYRTVRDPVKIINVYGYGYCGIFGPVMAGVWEDAGLGPARSVVLPGWNHVTSEVFYGGQWHYVDIDVRAVFRRSDGSLASLADARRDGSLWTGRGPLFFPNDPLEKTRKVYQETSIYFHHGYHQSGHTMDYVLRQGETFRRWWTPQGGRWHHAEVYHQTPFMRNLIETEPRGPAPNHRHFTVHNYANGRFVYRPDLTSNSSDFADGIYDSANLRPGEKGLEVIEPGEGYAVFEVRSPYVIVPKVGRLETTDDDSEASLVELDAENVRLAVSSDNGLTWRPLGTAGATTDLTAQVAGSYGYLLKLVVFGQPGQTLIRSLGITTWVQVAPASLPALAAGTNRMELRAGDHYGLPTRVVEIRSDASKPEKLLKYLVEPPEDYDPSRKTSRIHGAMVARVDAPPGAKVAWLSIGGSFQTHRAEAAVKTRNTMAYAVGEPANFREIYRADVPVYHDHWHYNAAREVMLDEPAGTVYVRYVGDPAVNNLQIYAHCLDEGPRPDPPGIVVEHAWTEAGERKSRRIELDRPGEYEILAGADPMNESVEISVPSRRRR
jgi:hypothetical protein